MNCEGYSSGETKPGWANRATGGGSVGLSCVGVGNSVTAWAAASRSCLSLSFLFFFSFFLHFRLFRLVLVLSLQLWVLFFLLFFFFFFTLFFLTFHGLLPELPLGLVSWIIGMV